MFPAASYWGIPLKQQQLEWATRPKGRAAKIQEPSELWELERWLAERRTGIDRKYDYRYSVLPLVLATLLREGNLTEDDLRGLGQDKLDTVRRAATLWARGHSGA